MLATSCEKDGGLGSGDATKVAISVATPQIATRAYSDGTTATELQYAVYDKNGNFLPNISGTTEIPGSTTVELVLTTGNTYDVLFWAAAPGAPYTFNPAEKTVTVNYGDENYKAVSNDESRDAFFARKTFTVSGKQTETVELTRPFAQLNVGTADYAESAKAGYTPSLSKVEVTAYQTLNLWDGTVANAATRTFDFAAIAKGETFPVAGYEYLAMNYLLVGADKETVEVKFFFKNEPTTYTHDRTIGAVPVQRNYRTNIFGNILTSEVDVNVTIDPAYEIPDYNLLQDEEITVKTEEELTFALASICKKIIIGKNIELVSATGNTIARDVVIDLNGYSITTDRNYVKNVEVEEISALVVRNGAKVTFVGEGSIVNTADQGAYAIAVYDNADVTIAGNITTGAYYDAMYVHDGRLTVCDGFHYAAEDTTVAVDAHGCHASTVINCLDDTYQQGKAVVVVKGGTYVNMDPSNVHEGKWYNQTFVAEGYEVVAEEQANGDVWFAVVAK